MSEEEKKAIKELIDSSNLSLIGDGTMIVKNTTIATTLNYIDKLQKVIDLMAFEIAENTGSCPLDIYDWENKKYDNCNNCNDTYKECFIEYFYKKAEEENEQ